MKSKIIFIFILLILGLPVILPLIQPGFPVTDDGEWMIIRFSAFHQALRDGQFPVRFVGRLNYGYGYPVVNFLYPGFMYLAEPIHLLGLGFIDSIKSLFIITMLGSSVFTFLWLRKLFSNFISLFGALVYLYIPYHLYDLYQRGSVGELLALMILPFIFWQIERKSFIWSVLGSAFLILSHNTLAFLFFPLIIFYKITKYENKELKSIIIKTLRFILYTLGISAFFWIPAIFELRYTRFSQIQVSEWQQYFADPNFIIFGVVIITANLALMLLRLRKLINTSQTQKAILFTAVGLIGVFMSIEYSSFLWEILPVTFIQFPYRFLSLLIPAAAFLTAYFLSQVNRNAIWLFVTIFTVILIGSSLPYLKVQGNLPAIDGIYATNEDTTTVKKEYMPIWVIIEPTDHVSNKIEIVKGNGIVNNYIANSKVTEISLTLLSDAVVRVNTIYYPGWKAYVDDNEVEIFYDNPEGVMEIKVPVNVTSVKLIFRETTLRLIANGISILAVIILLVRLPLKNYSRKIHK